MYEVFNVDFDDVVAKVKTLRKAQEICRDLNDGKLDKMYSYRKIR